MRQYFNIAEIGSVPRSIVKRPPPPAGISFFGNARVLTNIIVSLFLERFPKLKIVSVENGVGWVPFMLETLEYQMQEARIKYTIPPFELFRRQIYACSWFERRNFPASARMLGVDNVLFETDFPHPTCLYRTH